MKFKQGYYIAVNPIGIYHSVSPDKYVKKCKPNEFKNRIQSLSYEESIQCYMTKRDITHYNEIKQQYDIETE